MLSFFHGIHGIVGRQAKTSFRSRPFPNLSAAATDVAVFFSSRCDISRIHMNHIRQQTHYCTGTRPSRPGYRKNITFQVAVASLQANATACSRNCTAVPILATKDDTGATLQNTSSCATFLGAEWRKKRHKPTLRKAVLLFAHAYLTITIGSRGRLPSRLPGYSLARSLDLTYCSSRFVKKGQLEYRCKLRISVLVLRAWWALIGWAGWRCKLGGERVRAKRSDIRRCVSFLFWGMTEGIVKQSNGINGKKALCGYSPQNGKFMRARGY
jgi:hypothetical protein